MSTENTTKSNDTNEPISLRDYLWGRQYAINDSETPNEGFRRVAHTITNDPNDRDAYEAMLRDNRFMPGGRILAGAGTPHGNLLNCFSGDTLTHTKDGVFPISELAGRTAEVLSRDGVYRTAEFREFGKQELYEIVFDNGMTVRATAGHEWLVWRKKAIAQERVTTAELAGERIPYVFSSWRPESDDVAEGVRHGIVFGDGSAATEGHTYYVRLFGEKRHLVRYFTDHGHISESTVGEHATTLITGLRGALKALPDREASSAYWYGFFMGWLATDGCTDERGSTVLTSSDHTALAMLAAQAPRFGVVPGTIRVIRDKSPFGDQYGPCYALSFHKGSLVARDFLRASMASRFVTTHQGTKTRQRTTLAVSVKPLGIEESVYCAVEPQTHSFVIGPNLLTGNCFVQDGNPEQPGSSAWALELAMKLALVTKVGGGNGLNLDPIAPKRAYDGPLGRAFITIDAQHVDADKVASGTFKDLVHGQYVTRPYRFVTFVTLEAAPRAAVTLQVQDSVRSIWDAAASMVQSMLAGEDVLVDLSALRPEGAPVKGSGGTSSGPSSFAVEIFENYARWASLGGAEHAGPVATLRYVFATTLRAIRQAGVRRGAGMATMSITHPDLMDFITAKDLEREQAEGDISTFNISVLADDDFMRAAQTGGEAAAILSDIAQHAWQTGEPGLIYVDVINDHSALARSGERIVATNPSLRRGTRVLTHQGIIPIEELENRTFNVQTLGGAWAQARCFLSGNDKPLYRLTLSNGNDIYATPEHRWPVAIKGGGVAKIDTSELKPGHYIPFSEGNNGIQTWDSTLTLEEGLLLGWMYGDGWFGGDREAYNLMFTSDCLEVAERILKTYRHLSGTQDNNLKRNQDGTWTIQGGNATLRQAMQRFGVHSKSEGLPDIIWKSNPAFVQGFLEGLLSTDGSVTLPNDSPYGKLTLTTAHEALARDITDLLGFLGVKANMRSSVIDGRHQAFPNGQTYERDYARYDVTVNGAALKPLAHLTLHQPHKQERWQTLHERILEIRPTLPGFVRVEEVELTTLTEDVWDIQVDHPTHTFRIAAAITGNCGEIPLTPGEPCDLGAINLAAYVRDGQLDERALERDAALATRFLDDVLDAENAPLPEIHDAIGDKRRLGLGIMGLAHMLIRLGLRYDRPEGRAAAARAIRIIRDAAISESERLGRERGVPNAVARAGLQRRNIAILTVAPTGTISMLAGTSSGVEPVYAATIYRKIGTDYITIIDPLLAELLDENDPTTYLQHGGSNTYITSTPDGRHTWNHDRIVEDLNTHHGSPLPLLNDLPSDPRLHAYLTAHDIHPSDHVRMQATIQRTFDWHTHTAWLERDEAGKTLAGNSISKTINLPEQASVSDVLEAYTLAWREGCKGITVYRNNSRAFQVISAGSGASSSESDQASEAESVSAAADALAGDTLPVRAPHALEVQPRAQRLRGITDQVHLSDTDGNKRGFFLTVNSNELGEPREVFIISGKAGDEANGDSEALGRVVSIALQYGVPAEALMRTLRGINGGLFGTYHNRIVHSKADLVAVALETAMRDNQPQHLTTDAASANAQVPAAALHDHVHASATPVVAGPSAGASGVTCPSCGGSMHRSEGCWSCSCGYSKCQ